MKALVYHPAAAAELREAISFYRARSERLRNEFAAEVQVVTERLRELPAYGSPGDAGTRKALLKRFPFSVIYCVESERIFVYALMHHRREPDYWRGRTA